MAITQLCIGFCFSFAAGSILSHQVTPSTISRRIAVQIGVELVSNQSLGITVPSTVVIYSCLTSVPISWGIFDTEERKSDFLTSEIDPLFWSRSPFHLGLLLG